VTWSSGTTQDQDVLPPGVPDGKWRKLARNVRYENGVLSAQVLIHGKDVGDGIWMETKPDPVHGTWVEARIAIDFPLPEGQYLDISQGNFSIMKKEQCSVGASPVPCGIPVLEVKNCSQAPQNNITLRGTTQYQNVSTPDDLITCANLPGTALYTDSSCTSPLPTLPSIGQQFYTKSKNNACSSDQRGTNNMSYSYAPTTTICSSSPTSNSAQPMTFLSSAFGEEYQSEVHNVSTLDDLESCIATQDSRYKVKVFQDPGCKSPLPALPQVGDTIYFAYSATDKDKKDIIKLPACNTLPVKRIASPTDSPAAAPAS